MICYVSCQGDELMLEQQEEEEGLESFIAHVPVPSQKEVSLSVSLSVCLSVCLCVSLSASISLPQHIYIKNIFLLWCVCVSLCVCVSVCVCVCVQVEEALVRRKKMELLQRYASETLMAQSQEAKTLLGL